MHYELIMIYVFQIWIICEMLVICKMITGMVQSIISARLPGKMSSTLSSWSFSCELMY